MLRLNINGKWIRIVRLLKEEVASKGTPFISRFAPSPTGFLHMGHIASAIFVYVITRSLGGKIILRIENHDQTRCQKFFEDEILTDLHWLGFEADIGVARSDEFSEFRQTDRLNRYQQVMDQLANSANIYHCICSRRELAGYQLAQGGCSELRYPGICRSGLHQARENSGIRVEINPKKIEFRDIWYGEQKQIPSEQCGDILLRDRNGNYTYQFAVVVDDLDQNVNLIIRGEDLLASTGRQILLREMLGAKTHPLFLHHPLLYGDEGKKLSKRDGVTGIRETRLKGERVNRLIGEIAHSIGILEAPFDCSLNDLVDLILETI